MQFVYGLHIMWYEREMLEEHISSLKDAIENSPAPVTIRVAINLQTYIESPTDPSIITDFEHIVKRAFSIFANTEYEVITDDQSFYNIGDFRRSLKCDDGYVIWGEIDALLPNSFFFILAAVFEQVNEPHLVSFSSRKMWDHSWLTVEHMAFQSIPKNEISPPFMNDCYISQDELNDFNDKYEPCVIKLHTPKIDGALLAIQHSCPQLIGDEVHFCREDYTAELACRVYKIPQYHIPTILKGHNYKHPKKRVGTSATREDEIYKEYEQQSIVAAKKFIYELQHG